jgi:hypothetical protein
MADPTSTRTFPVEMTINLDDRDGRAVLGTWQGELGSMPREDFLAMVAEEFGVSILFPAAAEPPEPDQAESVPEVTPDAAEAATAPCGSRDCQFVHDHSTDRYAAMVEALVARQGRPGATALARQWLDAAGVPALLAELAEARAGEQELTTALAEANSVRPKMLDAVHDARTQRDEARAQMGRLASDAARVDADAERLRAERDDALAALAGVTPENYHTELRDRRNDDMAIRGILSPNGGPRVIAVEIGPTVAPAVEWLVTDRDSWRRLAEDFSPVVVAARALDAAWTRGNRDIVARNALLDAVTQLDKVEGKRRVTLDNTNARFQPDGWLAISTPYRAPETMTTRTVDGRFEMFDASVPPGGWVCAEWGDDADVLCRTPVESEPCPVHHPAAQDEPERMTDAEEAALLARQRDAVLAICARAEQAGRGMVTTSAVYDAYVTDSRDQPDTEPRTWAEGDPEPGPEVRAVRDRDGDVWPRRKRKGGWRFDRRDYGYGPLIKDWDWLALNHGPLTDATSEVAG